MRRILPFIAAAVLLVVPAGAWAYRQATDDGTLSVKDGYGTVWIGGNGNGARGALIGSLDSGTVTLTDPQDTNTDDLKVAGCDFKVVGESSVRCEGDKLRYRVVGGRFRIKIQGDGIALSVVGKGSVNLTAAETDLAGDAIDDPGSYKLNDDPPKPLPAKKTTYPLGG